MRAYVLCLVLAWLPSAAAAENNPLGMSYVETRVLKLIYFDPLNYLTPYAVRTFTKEKIVGERKSARSDQVRVT